MALFQKFSVLVFAGLFGHIVLQTSGLHCSFIPFNACTVMFVLFTCFAHDLRLNFFHIVAFPWGGSAKRARNPRKQRRSTLNPTTRTSFRLTPSLPPSPLPPSAVQCLEMTTKRKLIGRLVPCRCFRGEEEVISVLDYSHCSLQQVPKEIFSFERTLEELYLDANQIEELPKVTQRFLPKITQLYRGLVSGTVG